MEADVIICWNHGGVPKGLVEANFKRPTRVISLPNPASWAKAVEKYWPFPVRGIIKELAPDVIPLRVAALGFSASCQGVAQLLGSQDGAALDAVVAIDGIHTGYVQVEGKKEVNPNGMKPWFDFGKYAVVNERLFVVSHSSVVPPNYASTTQTAEWLWNTLTMEPTAFTVPPLPPLNAPPTSVHVSAGPYTGADRTIQYPAPPWKGKRRCGGLAVLGCSNLDKPGTADHIYQAKAMLPLMLQAFLAERWNDIDPKAPGQVCFVSGPETPFGWFPRGQGLGSAINVKSSASKCAGSAILPSDFIDSKSPAKFAPPLAYSGGSGSSPSKNSSLLSAAFFIGLGTLGLWWMSSKQQLGLRANPQGGNVRNIIGRAGWSFGLADRELRGDGAARRHNGLLYVLTDDSGDRPRDPRDPMHVGVYAADGDAGEWVLVGEQPFPNLRAALSHWQSIEVDAAEVRRVRAGDFNAGFLSNPKLDLRGLNGRDLVAAAVLIKDAPFADEDKKVDWAVQQYRKWKTEHPDEYELLHETTTDPRHVGGMVSDIMYFRRQGVTSQTRG